MSARFSRPAFAGVGESARMALATLWENKLRSFLTILGIVIGVTAIAAMTALIGGLDRQITGEIKEIGADNLFIRKYAGRIVTNEREMRRLEQRPDLTIDDVEAIEALPSVSRVDAMLGAAWPVARTVSHRGEKMNLQLIGASASYPIVNSADIGNGRFFTPTEVRNRARVVVLGQGVVDELMPHVDPVGKTVRIGGRPYAVVGVFEEQVVLMWGQTKDTRVVLPYTSFYRDFGGGGAPGSDGMDVLAIAVPTETGGVEEAKEDITFLMRQRHRLRPGEENDFDIVSQSSFLELWDQITGSVFLAMIVISSIALMVGGIGVMNIMLVSVTERTREIGVRKALGARRRDILWQFLIEAAVLTGVGGIFGVVIGGALGAGVAKLIDFPVALSPTAFAVGVAFSAAIGIGFGLFPANKAANLDPIDALRYE